MLGGMSWESTLHYYQLINQRVKERCGGLHSAKIVMESVDFQPLEKLMRKGDWQSIESQLTRAAQRLEQSSADCLLICTNTMHKVADSIQKNIDIPLLHIADATGERICADKLTRVGLLGTRFTMEEQFYRLRLGNNFDLEVIVPEEDDRKLVDLVIFTELCHGTVDEESRQAYLSIMAKMQRQGAQGIIEGCTEINMLVTQQHTDIPLYDTTTLHATKAVEFALQHGE